MTIVGLDTLGLLLLMVAIAIMLTYILWYGWLFQFTKRQFGFLVLVLIMFGMFAEAWLRETGDELLIGLGLFVIALVLLLRGVFSRRKRKRAPSGQ